MKTVKGNKIKAALTLMVFIMILAVTSCSQNTSRNDKTKSTGQDLKETNVSGQKYKVTFIELGSVRCIPCRQMQPVMKSIEAKYGKDVKVEFHDVWTEAGKPFGEKYGIEAIPTQVFLDETGKEFYRHVGFFPEEELLKILQMKGVKLN